MEEAHVSIDETGIYKIGGRHTAVVFRESRYGVLNQRGARPNS